MSRPKVISLFSGAGGLDYGFEEAGFETVVVVERDQQCCETLRKNRPKWSRIDRDITGVQSGEILAAGGLKKGEAAVLVGGPPCQPFSKSGYWRRGESLRLEDPRANTLAAYLRVLEETTPQTFLLENVEGLAYEGKDEGLRLLIDAIEVINKKTKSKYRPTFQILNAADYGIPQLRKRVLMIASRDGATFKFPAPTHSPAEEQNSLLGRLSPYRTAWDAIADVEPGADEALEMRGTWGGLLASIPEGNNYLWHTDRGGGLPLFGWRRRYWSFLLKLSKSQPSWTIQAQPGPAIGPFHWSNRRLSSRELCRLQTIPDNVTITGGRTAVQKQVGNAVPSLLAEVMAREMRVQLLGLTAIRGAPKLLPPDRSPAPSPEPTRRVPPKFRALVGSHAAHPGPGKGKGAVERAALLA